MLLTLLFALFVIGTVVLVAKILYTGDLLPWSCPRCGFGGDEDIAGNHQLWYWRTRTGLRCRTCRTDFKEHPNGTIVEDHDP